jgi:hypothetical protein
MGGLLIDIAYNFLNSTTYYDDFAYYDEMSREIFLNIYTTNLKIRRIRCFRSKQRVKVRKSFRRKSKKAYDLACKD